MANLKPKKVVFDAKGYEDLVQQVDKLEAAKKEVEEKLYLLNTAISTGEKSLMLMTKKLLEKSPNTNIVDINRIVTEGEVEVSCGQNERGHFLSYTFKLNY